MTSNMTLERSLRDILVRYDDEVCYFLKDAAGIYFINPPNSGINELRGLIVHL